jgi:hypothetical protein
MKQCLYAEETILEVLMRERGYIVISSTSDMRTGEILNLVGIRKDYTINEVQQPFYVTQETDEADALAQTDVCEKFFGVRYKNMHGKYYRVNTD